MRAFIRWSGLKLWEILLGVGQRIVFTVPLLKQIGVVRRGFRIDGWGFNLFFARPRSLLWRGCMRQCDVILPADGVLAR